MHYSSQFHEIILRNHKNYRLLVNLLMRHRKRLSQRCDGHRASPAKLKNTEKKLGKLYITHHNFMRLYTGKFLSEVLLFTEHGENL